MKGGANGHDGCHSSILKDDWGGGRNTSAVSPFWNTTFLKNQYFKVKYLPKCELNVLMICFGAKIPVFLQFSKIPNTKFYHDRVETLIHNHPGLAENIAPDGGPGSDIIVVRL